MKIKAPNDVKSQIESLIARKTQELDSLKTKAEIQDRMNTQAINSKSSEIGSLRDRQSVQTINNDYQDYVKKSVEIPKNDAYDKVLEDIKNASSTTTTASTQTTVATTTSTVTQTTQEQNNNLEFKNTQNNENIALNNRNKEKNNNNSSSNANENAVANSSSNSAVANSTSTTTDSSSSSSSVSRGIGAMISSYVQNMTNNNSRPSFSMFG